jgi:hypothetical protein
MTYPAQSEPFTADEIRDLPTLCTGQADSLKVDDGTMRVWLSRCTVEDGEPYNDKITIEHLIDGLWVTTNEYPG